MYYQKKLSRLSIFSLAFIVYVSLGQAKAQDTQQDLNHTADEPTFPKMVLQVLSNYSGAYYLLPNESQNVVMFRIAKPFKIRDRLHVAGIGLPIVTRSPLKNTGLSDTSFFDLVVFNEDWGRWGVGIVGFMPTASNATLGREKWAAGPAAAFVVKNSNLMWGLFNQNFISFAGNKDRQNIKFSIFQPIWNHKLSDKWAIGTTDMYLTYDWDYGSWTSIPLGLKLSRLTSLGQVPTQISGGYEYNFADDRVGPKWTLNLIAKFIF